MASDWEGVSLALGPDNIFTVSPTWTRLDVDYNVSSISIRRGKTSVFEKTDTGTCTVTINDTSGFFDYTAGPSPNLIGLPFAVAIRNPITDEWFPLFRGQIDEVNNVLSRSKVKMDTVITAVDALDYFANFELVPGLAGFATGLPNDGGYVTYPEAGFDERIADHVLGDCAWPVGLQSIFTGNIIVQQSIYSPGDKVLQVIQEACDAEFPTVANYYVDKRGIFQVHGRYARFDPAGVSATASNWDYNAWQAAENVVAAGDPAYAKLQPPFSWNVSRKLLYNAALAYPQGFDRADLGDFIITDEGSRDAYGTRTWTAENLQVQEGTTTGNNAKDECKLYSQYIIDNYASPSVPRVEQMSVGSEHPDLEFGDGTWAFICGADISDSVELTIAHPGGGGFAASQHFIEGITMTIDRGPGSLDNSYPIVKMTCDLSPGAYWSSNPFGSLPT